MDMNDLKASARAEAKTGLRRLWQGVAAHPRFAAIVLLILAAVALTGWVL